MAPRETTAKEEEEEEEEVVVVDSSLCIEGVLFSFASKFGFHLLSINSLQVFFFF